MENFLCLQNKNVACQSNGGVDSRTWQAHMLKTSKAVEVSWQLAKGTLAAIPAAPQAKVDSGTERRVRSCQGLVSSVGELPLRKS